MITNPSMKQFEDFTGQKNTADRFYLRRSSNWLIFSIYKLGDSTSYFAIFNNFYLTEENLSPLLYDDGTPVIDKATGKPKMQSPPPR